MIGTPHNSFIHAVKNAAYRWNVAQEILKTEEVYVQNLDILCNVSPIELRFGLAWWTQMALTGVPGPAFETCSFEAGVTPANVHPFVEPHGTTASNAIS